MALLLGMLGSSLTLAAGEPPPLLSEPVIAALADELSGTNARHIVQELTLHHRMRASRGIRAAAETIIRRLESYGLEGVEILELVADGELFYGTQRSRPAWDVELAELWELREVEGEWPDAELIDSWETRPLTLAQDSASGEITADLVDVGEGTSAADYRGREVRGKLVLASAQPGAVAKLAVGQHGAAGIVSWAQNQKSAWWGEDRNLVRWGHMDTFPAPESFGFMVSVNQAAAWRERLDRGERVRLRARVAAGQSPGLYTIPTAVIAGSDPQLADQEIVFSCHLDHPRPGANDNASGCAAILEVARTLNKLIVTGKLERPRRSIRFFWPPEIEGTIALLVTRPELAERTRAVIHMDMVGGHPERTKSIFHVTRSPASLPTFVNDVAETFGRFVNEQSYEYAATGRASYPLVDPEGSRQALQARYAGFSMGSDHQVWTEGSFRVPAIYLNDWPDRYIHTDGDRLENIDPTKLLRAACIGAASAYYLADLRSEHAGELMEIVRGHALARTARALERSRRLGGWDGRLVIEHQLEAEERIVESVGSLVAIPAEVQAASVFFLRDLRTLAEAELAAADATPGESGTEARLICRRRPEPKGPMWGFDYSYLEDHLARQKLPAPDLLGHQGLWGGGQEYAYEVLNLVDGGRSVAEIRDTVTAIYGPVPLEQVRRYLDTLQAIGVVACGE